MIVYMAINLILLVGFALALKYLFLDAISSLETGLLVGWLVMLFENFMKYIIIKDMIISMDQ